MADQGGVIRKSYATWTPASAPANIDGGKAAPPMSATRETLIRTLMILADMLAGMHESHGLESAPAECMACLAFEESRVLDVLEAVGAGCLIGRALKPLTEATDG